MGQQLSPREMAAYYAGRKCAAAGRRAGLRIAYETDGERTAFDQGYQHLRDEEESRRLLDECRRLSRYSALDVASVRRRG